MQGGVIGERHVLGAVRDPVAVVRAIDNHDLPAALALRFVAVRGDVADPQLIDGDGHARIDRDPAQIAGPVALDDLTADADGEHTDADAQKTSPHEIRDNTGPTEPS